mgnify:CR=1 FL=1
MNMVFKIFNIPDLSLKPVTFYFLYSTPDAKYFVPAQLRSSPDKLLDVQPSENDPCSLYVHFLDGFLPHGLFPQVFLLLFLNTSLTSVTS